MAMLWKMIDLSDEEREVLDHIKFNFDDLDGFDDVQRNGEAVLKLIGMLVEREAIPEHRVRYFVDPDYNIGGRGRSKKQGFERNGCTGNDIYTHVHFLKYLKYFIYGADLPPAIIDKFSDKVASCGRVSSGDVVPLGAFARQLARSSRLEFSAASEEFYKLALDCGLSQSYASSIRNSVKQGR
ncbi:hypothetical protein [Azospirillum argentinense]|uniref:hypothetical protein n=1 Tax=Azospirillum argentinense TaxID=2970906 RepID=UPI0010BFC0B7|nr:hypothetical protein [Azospirillum argentinense]